MGFLSKLFGKAESSGDATVDWLSKVDTAYNKSFAEHSINPLKPYCTRLCLMAINDDIMNNRRPYAGLDRYMNTDWEASGDPLKWHKLITYDSIKMSHGITVPVGNDKQEIWTLVLDENSNKVQSIEVSYDEQ